jgi:pimeloyl-ACP methyl ester carboxylesterase
MNPTVVTVPCFSGAPWDVDRLTPMSHRPLRTMRLPDEVDSIEKYADFVEQQLTDLSSYVLVGDSFGAVVALAVATRQIPGLQALVVSGGFAANPVASRLGRMKIDAARYLPGPLYRRITLRLHAAALSSPYDREGDTPMGTSDFRQLFLDHTPWRAYVNRARAAFSVDLRHRLHLVRVPTLILTPEHDTLIGEDAARVMREGVADATEVVLPRTGHMFRFTHPVTYATAIEDFLSAHVTSDRRQARSHLAGR